MRWQWIDLGSCRWTESPATVVATTIGFAPTTVAATITTGPIEDAVARPSRDFFGKPYGPHLTVSCRLRAGVDRTDTERHRGLRPSRGNWRLTVTPTGAVLVQLSLSGVIGSTPRGQPPTLLPRWRGGNLSRPDAPRLGREAADLTSAARERSADPDTQALSRIAATLATRANSMKAWPQRDSRPFIAQIPRTR